jgi:hypothetical protein
MKHTAMDWLFSKLSDIERDKFEWQIILKEAKEMEKEQIINANRDGVDMVVNKENFITGEQYYNETYGDDT